MNDKSPMRLKFKDTDAVQASSKPNGPPSSNGSPQAAKPKTHPPAIGTEPVVVKCGHSIVFDLYAKDTFREQRRAKAVSRDCPACRQERVKADALAAKERRAKKKATFAKALKPRLPDGARFAATYDASAVQWTGTLTVDGVTFERQGSSLSKLLHKLDDVYRTTTVIVAPSPDPAGA
ncbi:MAG TPA: hypothetical protein VLE97_06000 [Gaiellaceae bacterium]|nr:hypothetical protein [Gaiellaceae bacterium]